MSDELIKILVVEDEQAHAELIRMAFQRDPNSYELNVANTIKEAEKSISEQKPDIAIIDLNLPDGTGTDLIKNASGLIDFPSLIMTSFGDENVAVEAIKFGALDYIVKSDTTFIDMPHIVERALREWRNIHSIKQAEEERKRIEYQLLQSQKMETIGTMAGGIAHDFNNILTPIMGYVGMVMDELPTDSKAYNQLSIVRKAAYRAKELVDQILMFSRKMDQDFKPIHLQTVLDEAIKLIRASTPSTVKVNIQIDKECAQISGNGSQLHQVVMNICTNANHAMSEGGGELTVSLSMEDITEQRALSMNNLNPGDYVKLTIADSGVGMDQSTKERIFEPFFTTKDVGKGTGLGLSVTHGIVLSHRGYIQVDSEAGKGTTFTIYFPALKNADDSRGGLDKKAEGGSEHILVVDDEEDIVIMAKEMLTGLGYTVDAFVNSKEALEFFKKNSAKIDILISDKTMPYLNGLLLITEVKQIKPSLHVILMTGFTETISQENCHELGISDLIKKPISKQALDEIIRKVLSK
ncbi:MAG: response regulator [Calditrichaeota bacterium]|nr:response regulator [Calditrichota bacterium]